MTINSSSVESQKDKLSYLLRVASIVIAITAVGWTVFCISIQDWLTAAIMATLILIGYMGYRSIKQNNTKAITNVYFPLLFIVVCFVCLFLDVPNSVVPRATHNYFLPMALYAYVLYQDRHSNLKIIAPALIGLAFLVFASTNFGINFSSIPNEQRLLGIWVTNGISLVMLALVEYIMQSNFQLRHALELELSKALLRNEIQLYFQPQVNEHGVTHGAEVLARWNHPNLGAISPDVFIPLAEKTDLIFHLGKHVLVTACDQLTIWAKSDATAHLTLSVNISVKQFQHPEFVQNIITLVNDTKINAHQLQIEITESIFADNLEEILEKITQLKSLGVKLSLDDFGTGYSSLAYVKSLPLDELKIDKSFIKDVLTNASDAAIVKMIISLTHELHMTVIAEGVETAEQRQFLIDHGCHHFQGNFFSLPISTSAFHTFALAHWVKNS